MDSTRIEVQCYCGYKGGESPRRFLWKESWVEVQEILDRWYRGSVEAGQPIVDYFRLSGDDGREYLLRRGQEDDAWFLVKRR